MNKFTKVTAVTVAICTTIVTSVYAKEAPDIIKINGDDLMQSVYEKDDEDSEIIEAIAPSTTVTDVMEETEKNIEEVERIKAAAEEALKKEPAMVRYKSQKILYASKTIVVRSNPEDSNNVIGQISPGDEVKINGKVIDSNYFIINYNGETSYIQEENLSPDKWYFTYNHDWDGAILNRRDGVVLGPTGYESYYNLPMGGVVEIMRNMGFSEEEYPYWVRDDGAKMLGNYIMVAADHSKFPRGCIVTTSLGQGLVCDTGDFIYTTNRVFDIAVDWK